nr:membrane-spanning 4-domains subfamily A member 4A-like [Labrus bergylta]
MEAPSPRCTLLILSTKGSRCVRGCRRSAGHTRLLSGRCRSLLVRWCFCLGLPWLPPNHSLGVYSGFFVWGAAFYITAGSLTVAAGKSSNRCLVNTALGFNVVASVASGTAIILYTLDATISFCFDCPYPNQMHGISGVLAVFHLLEFIVSITVSAFACKATCNCGRQQQQPFYIIPGNASMGPQAVPTFEAASASVTLPPPQMVNLHKEGLTVPEPPAYDVN